MEVIYLKHLLIEYLEKYNFLKTADAESIFADVKSIIHIHLFSLYLKLTFPSLQLKPINVN